jgi:hypothetical protein
MATLTAARSRSAESETLLIALALAHGLLLLARPSVALIAIGMWWSANTVSHNFIHRPFFTWRPLNRAFSFYLTLVLGFPQSLWRARHLAHHDLRRGLGNRLSARRDSRRELLGFLVELGLLMSLWGAMAAVAPHFAVTVYVPGCLLGLGLCGVQGHYEHVRGPVSHYGWFYNMLFFNDGYHIEHHAHPGLNWRDLPQRRATGGCSSQFPAVLRSLECINLEVLERLVLRYSFLQRFVIERHEQAMRTLLVELPPPGRIGIVGGGLFPRTAIILQRLMPHATLTLIDVSAENLVTARRFLNDQVQEINRQFDPAEPCDFDLLVIPLCLIGDRRAIYERPRARAVLVHDWIWKPVGTSSIVSWLLLKRLNLVIQ